MSRPGLHLIEAAVALALIAASSVPPISSLVTQLYHKPPRDNFYEDEDGKSTPEAIAALSNRWSKTMTLVFAAIGFASSLALAILNTITSLDNDQDLFIENWLIFASWVLLGVQAIAIASTHDAIRAYNDGLWTWFGSLVLALVLLVQNTRVLGHLLEYDIPSFALRVVNLSVTLGLFGSSVSIQRRPDVFRQGRIIDRKYTVSAYSRFTWSWASGVINTARAKKDLEVHDLPRPDHYTRTQDTSAAWKQTPSRSSLWSRIIWYFRWTLLTQWTIAIFRNFLSIAPHWVTLQILRALEQRQTGEPIGVETWLLVFWLGFTLTADAWATACLFWLSWSEILVPLRGLLSAIIVEKAMRRKNVKATSKSDPVADAGKQGDDDNGEAEEDENALKSQQAIVNLIGVDAKRISDFTAFQIFIPLSVSKLIVAVWFLINLLGWVPLAVGLATWLVIMPLNIYFSKKYAAAQDRLMKLRDQKLAVVNESLQGMRQIKFSALESQWEDRILAVRENELKAIWDVFKSDTVMYGSWIASPVSLAAASLAVYAWLHGGLSPSVAFVSIGIFNALELALSIIPEIVTDYIDANVSIGRLQKYLESPEITQNVSEGPDVAFENADVAWPVDEDTDDAERFILRDLNLSFPSGELSVISGKTGTGKSLLLAAVLGESDLVSGKLYAPKAPSLDERRDDKAHRGNWILPGSIAYVSQIPWIENATVKENILFGLPLDEDRFSETITACALEKDLHMLSDGDKTELGANGVNLSGGQKWRVTLARAIYSRAGILVLDDIFSAVDAHVGRHIFEKCLTGSLCQGRTRILVTHHVGLVESKAKYIVELGDGVVQHAGLLSELEVDGTLQLIKSHEEESQQGPCVDEGNAKAAQILESQGTTAVNSSAVSERDSSQNVEADDADGAALHKIPSKTARQFVEDETREKGAIKTHIYGAYMRDSGGWTWWIIATIVFVSFELITLGRSWWLKIWTSDNGEETVGATATHGNLGHAYAVVQQSMGGITASNISSQATQRHSLEFYLWVYVAIAVVTAVLGTLRYFYLLLMSLKASRRLFSRMTHVVLRAPLRWMDTVPIGRVLNRFTADFNIIDSRIAMNLTMAGSSGLSVVGICVAATFVSPYIILLAAALLLVCSRIAALYLGAARPSKRLESTTKSPIFELFGSALSGVTTIRSFDKARTYIHAMYDRIDDYDMATWHLWLFNRWMGWRMSLVGAAFSVVVSVVVLRNSEMDAALAGFTLSFALQFSEAVLWALRNYADIELDMNAAERVVEYSELPTEDQGGADPPATWPTEGRLEVKDLEVSYAEDLEPVLKGLTFDVAKNERIGVVGRTGAGKSSLTLALFRFLEARAGSIHIDGLDISKIKLSELRSRLAIIPQDPVLFSGTIRSNLDAFGDRTDAELRDSLQRVHLVGSTSGSTGTSTPVPGGESSGSATPTATPTNTNPFSSLATPISEGGFNLSQGQRQLLCLARAIVARPKVMVLDEATSAVDMSTDALIQRSIREEFTQSTLIVIAHRLSTIADFDRILVLSEGRVAEFGSPKDLWEKGDGKDGGVFRGMCEESGEKEKLRDMIFGGGGN